MAETKEITAHFDAAKLYRDAERTLGLWKADTEDKIQLFRGEVIESDSPASGHSDDPSIEPFIRLDGPLEVRKSLHLDRVDCFGAQIGFIAIEDPNNRTTLRLLVNGIEVLRPPSDRVAPEARQYTQLSWSRWYYVDIPSTALLPGANEIRLSAVDGGTGWQLMVADYREFGKGAEHGAPLPRDSDRHEIDAGWTRERGEYVVRLLLDRYRREGELKTRVFDGAGEQDQPLCTQRRLEHLQVHWSADIPDQSELALAFRTGPGPFTGPDWGPWQSCKSGDRVPELVGRYVQAKINWQTTHPCYSPALVDLTMAAQIRNSPVRGPRVAGYCNPRIRRSSYEMPHEDPRHSSLQQLRQMCELDAVVAGAQTEFETIQRLHHWAYHIPLDHCHHAPWKVLDWIDLRRDADGNIQLNTYSQRRRDKMCLYPNVVLVAALQSFGLIARHLNFHSEGMTGHEICEVWSNDHGKWIHLDATRDYYWVDRRTLIPLDTEEIHRVLVDRLEDVETWERPYLFRQDLELLVEDLPIIYWSGEYEHSAGAGDHGALFLFRSFCHFRIIPRFDVFSRPLPLPVSQGLEVWSWDGYLNWAEDRVPPLPHFSHHTNRRDDFYPTLNQTRFTALNREDGQRLYMAMETSMPDFAVFQVRFDRGDWREMPAVWDWDLRDGMNTAEMRSRSRSGVTGLISALSVVA